MSTKFFGQFLLEKGVISREVLLDAVQHQKSINLPLCALAVEHGYLTAEQLEALDAEHTKSDRKFMEIALQDGMLTYGQLESLSKVRSERWVFFGEALVRRGHLSLVELNTLFEEYRAKQQPAADELTETLADVPDKLIISSLLRTTLDLFLHYTKQIIKVKSVVARCEPPEDIAYVFAQKVTGNRPFFYALALPEELTLLVADYIMQEENARIDEMVLDAVTEFVNIVVGNACASLDMADYKVSAEPPQLMLKETFLKLLSSCNGVTVDLETAKGDFRAFFLFCERG